ncbi:uncharacterized protein LOC128554323 [Mercenaria mercenaria]|uniref:uncharacterized protein LOC128554323 n=1 Tax=Mercenaria mercenaria TaxID=6596 RepID=UPI00234FAECE|nr:uncharacterized protein LOC128554323 [Mercenaria mercenaria]
MSDGVYVKGFVEDVPIVFTADTVASKTVISSKVFKSVNQGRQPALEKSSCLIGAGGTTIQECGKAKFTLKLGPLEITSEAIIADIEDEALLGYDVLKGREHGAADILLSKNKIVLDGVEIPCFQVGKNDKTRRVVVADDLNTPGQSEMIIDVYVSRKEEDDFDHEAEYLVEPSEHLAERYKLAMASTLVNINQATTCKVRVLNPFREEVSLKQDAEIGKAEKIERIVNVIAEQENTRETENQAQVGRVETRSNKHDGDMQLPFEPSTEEKVPRHLHDLFSKTIQGRSEKEKQAIAGLFGKYSSTFSTDELDIGLTNLIEHSIDTGDAKPIKQRPRRVPLAFANEEKQAIEDRLKKGLSKKARHLVQVP